jgi:hypothetical protein
LIKLFPSQLTWTENGANLASSNSFCWRFIKLTRELPRTDIHPLYKQIGELHENLHAQDLAAAGEVFQREVSWRFETQDYYLSGRCDFKLKNSVDECKSTLKPLHGKDVPKDEHLYQLCLYLGYFELSEGRLIYGRIQQNKAGELIRTATEEVPVTIEDNGAIMVGRRDTGFTMDKILEPAAGLAAAIASDDIPDRPIPRGWHGPCKYCPLSGACNEFDHGNLTPDELRAAVPDLIKNQVVKDPHITTARGK